MDKIRKIVVLLCLGTLASRAATVTFGYNESAVINNKYFDFTVGESSSEIARVSIKENFPNNNVMQKVTLIIPGGD